MALKRKYLLFIATVIFFPLSLLANASTWNIVPEKSNITFTATQNGAPVSGTFKDFSGNINFDPAHLDTSKVNIVVKIASMNTSYKEVASTLQTAEWLDAKDYPTAVFDASKFTHVKDNQYQADGTLTIRNKSLPVTLLFTLEKYTTDAATAKGTVTLKRTAFGVGTGEWTSTKEVKDEVAVNFVIEAKH